MRALQGPLSELPDVDGWRDTVGPAADTWWWEAASELEGASGTGRIDALANALSIAFLGLAASFTVGIFQALSTDGISWTETFGTLVQASGLALVGSGTLTRTGRRRVAQMLSRVGIRRKLQAEVMCAATAALAATLWAAHDQVLPNAFHMAGVAAYDRGELRVAREHFNRALALNDRPGPTLIFLGRISETLEDDDDARGFYHQAMLTGEPEAFNYLGRVLLTQQAPDPDHAAALLYLGLQRAYVEEVSGTRSALDLAELRMNLHRNLAWALLEQADRAEADAPRRARRLRATSVDHLGKVDALQPEVQRLLADLHARKPDGTRAVLDLDMEACIRAAMLPDPDHGHRRTCVDAARPETIGEFRYILDRVAPNCPLNVETKGIIQLETGKNDSVLGATCQEKTADAE